MLRIQQFDDQAKGVMAGAYHVSQRFAHSMVDSPHLVMALLEQTGSAIPLILERLSVDRDALSARLDALLRAKPASASRMNPQQVFIAPSAKAALDRAAAEAQSFQEAMVAPEHLLLALLREQGTPLAGLLAEFGVTHDRVRAVVQSLRDAPPFVKN